VDRERRRVPQGRLVGRAGVQPLPLLAAIDERPAAGGLAREFSAAHAVPDLQPARPLTGVHRVES